jgi:hypothetical protein
MTALEAAAQQMSDRSIAWTDFDKSLGEMPGELERLIGFFGLAADPEQLRKIAEGPLMRRYSKALEYEYSPSLRRDLIDDATRRHGRDIADAIAMLERAAASSPLLARALERS